MAELQTFQTTFFKGSYHTDNQTCQGICSERDVSNILYAILIHFKTVCTAVLRSRAFPRLHIFNRLRLQVKNFGSSSGTKKQVLTQNIWKIWILTNISSNNLHFIPKTKKDFFIYSFSKNYILSKICTVGMQWKINIKSFCFFTCQKRSRSWPKKVGSSQKPRLRNPDVQYI